VDCGVHQPQQRILLLLVDEFVVIFPQSHEFTLISAILATGAFQFHDYLDRSVSGNDDDEIVRFRCVGWLVIGVGWYEYEVAGVDRLFLLQLLTGQERSAAADHVYRRFAVDVVVRG